MSENDEDRPSWERKCFQLVATEGRRCFSQNPVGRGTKEREQFSNPKEKSQG